MRASLKLIVAVSISAIAFLHNTESVASETIDVIPLPHNARSVASSAASRGIEHRHQETKPIKYELFYRPKPEKIPVEEPVPPKKKPEEPVKDEPKQYVLEEFWPTKYSKAKEKYTTKVGGDPPVPELVETSPDEPMVDDEFESSGDMTDIPSDMFTLSPTFAPLSTEACEAAISIELGDTVTGTTLDGIDAKLPSCGSLGGNFNAPSVFYSFVGSGDGIQITFSSFFDIDVAVYSGQDCDELSCITGDYVVFLSLDGLYSGSLSVASQAGEKYYIVPHSFVRRRR